MGGFIARQPNGLICRYSSVVDCITDYNMTEDDYIQLCVERAIKNVKLEAEINLQHMCPFSNVREYFIPREMTETEFEKIMRKMTLPKEQCKHEKVF